jgi:hypothetical protein
LINQVAVAIGQLPSAVWAQDPQDLATVEAILRAPR